MRLLIVDDSDILRTRLADILSEIRGIKIVGEEESSHRAAEAVERLKPDLVILDIRMPGENGMTVIETIKKRKNPPIVIMFTNYPYLQYRKRCMDLGADFFFYKAIEFQKLIKLIEDFMKIKDFANKKNN